MKLIKVRKLPSVQEPQAGRVERRKENMICVIVVFIVILFGMVVWLSENFAISIGELVFEIIGIFGGVTLLKKVKLKRTKIVLVIAMGVFLLDLTVAKAVLGDMNDQKEQAGNSTISSSEEPQEPEYEKFDWENNIYIMNLGEYCNTTGDKTECIKKLIKECVLQYSTGENTWEMKSDEELNGGDYGNYIHNANGYSEDYANAKMPKVKVKALEEEINERENAKEICEKFDNLKLLGDAYVKMAENSDFSVADRIENLEVAVKNYIKALMLAYNDDQSSNKYIAGIWDALSVAYFRISNLETTDLIHEENSEKLGEICAQGMSFVGGK